MKKLTLLLVAFMVNASFAAQLVTESVSSRCDSEVGSCVPKKIAHVCVTNVDSKHHLGVITTWNVGDGKHLSWIRLGTQMVFRLVSDAELKDAKFEITFRKGLESAETILMPLEFTWGDAPSSDCTKLPNYEFKLVKTLEGKEEFSLAKVIPKP